MTVLLECLTVLLKSIDLLDKFKSTEGGGAFTYPVLDPPLNRSWHYNYVYVHYRTEIATEYLANH